MDDDSHPYVVFLPSEHKVKILSAIFGSRAAVDILKFSLKQGISKKVYQNELVKKLSYSNKTLIENLKSLTKLKILASGCSYPKTLKMKPSFVTKVSPSSGTQFPRPVVEHRDRLWLER